MCGRFALKITPQLIAEMFGLAEVPELQERYNIAPGEAIAAVRSIESGRTRVLKRLRWGLIPGWMKPAEKGAGSSGMPGLLSGWINARSETAAVKPAFREAFKQRRCLIPASGFYEWRKQGKVKQPYYFQMADKKGFAFAGLWDRWSPSGAEQAMESCAILTTAANELMLPIHNRMPVIVAAEHYQLWLDMSSDKETLARVMRPYPSERMNAHPVSRKVNKPDYDDPQCIEPIENESRASELF